MNAKAEIVVIGGGISGCAILYELSRSKAKVALLDKGQVASATTGDSGGYIRKFNLDPYLQKLASESFDYYQNFSQEVGGSCEFLRTGLVSRVSLEALPSLMPQIEELQAMGHGIIVSDAPPTNNLRQKAYNKGDSAFIYEPTLGNINTKLTCRSWVQAACNNGAVILENTPVQKILTKDNCIYGVQTPAGIIECQTVILSAGAWSKDLLLDLPIDSEKITPRSFQYNIYKDAAKYLDIAFMDNVAGFYIAPFRDGSLFLGSLGNKNQQSKSGEEPVAARRGERVASEGVDEGETGALCTDQLVVKSHYDHEVSNKLSNQLHNLLQNHFPWVTMVESISAKRSYDAFTDDGYGVVKSFEELPGLVVATGWSSGGIKSAPAVAKEVTRLVSGKALFYGGQHATANTPS